MHSLIGIIRLLFTLLILAAIADIFVPGHNFSHLFVLSLVYIFSESVHGLIEIISRTLTILVGTLTQTFNRLPPEATQIGLGALFLYTIFRILKK